jgi:hypothetical protein
MNTDRPAPDVASYLENGAGDCELRSIAFAFPDVHLSFYDPYYDRSFCITLREVNFVYFTSNHVQNVVGRIYCFSDWDEAMVVETFSKLVSATIASWKDFKILPEHPVLCIEPVTGGDLVAQYKTMEIKAKVEASD